MTVRVLLADDQQLIRAGFHRLIHAEPEFDVVGEATDVAELAGGIQRLRPDVALVELTLGDRDTLEVLRRLPRRADGRPAVAPVALTIRDQEADVLSAFGAGVLGYVVKSEPVSTLFAAITAVASGRAYACPVALGRLIRAALTPSARPSPCREGSYDRLTSRQRDVLNLISAGLSNAEIAQVLTVSDGTVKSHVSEILTRLGLQSRQQAMVFAFRSGLAPGA